VISTWSLRLVATQMRRKRFNRPIREILSAYFDTGIADAVYSCRRLFMQPADAEEHLSLVGNPEIARISICGTA
jgi:hypothetical protein